MLSYRSAGVSRCVREREWDFTLLVEDPSYFMYHITDDVQDQVHCNVSMHVYAFAHISPSDLPNPTLSFLFLFFGLREAEDAADQQQIKMLWVLTRVHTGRF